MIAKSRLKLTIAVSLSLVILVGVLGIIAGLGRLFAYFNTGADPAGIFQLVPTVPIDLKDRVVWVEDLPTAAGGPEIAPYTRDQIAGAYLYAWAQVNISYELNKPYGLKTYFSSPALDAMSSAITSTVAAGWQIRQSNLHHRLALAFLSDEGSVVAFTDQSAEVVQQLLDADGNLSAVIEGSSIYDVVMRMEDGNWRIRDMVRRGDGQPATTAAVPLEGSSSTQTSDFALTTDFVRVRGNSLVFQGKEFHVAGINYYPQGSPWTKFWPEYRATTTMKDLDLIKQLGLNTIRIFISYEDFGADAVQQSAIDKLLHFLDQAEARQLKVIVTIFDHHTDHNVRNWAADDRHMAALIPPVANHPAILAWDIKNEPNRDYDYNSQELVDAWLRHVARIVRGYDANHLITIGWSQPEAAANLLDIVDFVSFHYFEELADYSTRLGKLIDAANGKPVLLQEFVLPTWNSFWPHGHTEAEQASYYAALLHQNRQFQTAGYMVWTLHDFESVPLAEFSMPWQRATQANMGLLRLDGSTKPAAAVITAGGMVDLPPIPWWSRWVKPFWLLVYGLFISGTGAVLLLFRWWRRRRSRPKGERPPRWARWRRLRPKREWLQRWLRWQPSHPQKGWMRQWWRWPSFRPHQERVQHWAHSLRSLPKREWIQRRWRWLRRKR